MDFISTVVLVVLEIYIKRQTKSFDKNYPNNLTLASTFVNTFELECLVNSNHFMLAAIFPEVYLKRI